MARLQPGIIAALLGAVFWVKAECSPILNDDLFNLPKPGAIGLRILSSNLLELTLITTKDPDPAPVTEWDFVHAGILTPPSSAHFNITVENAPRAVNVAGFKRRPVYAPLKERDLRIGNHLYLSLAQPLEDGDVVQVSNPPGNLLPPGTSLLVTNDSFRFNPAIHVNQAGYATLLPKKGTIGYYLGSAGELPIPAANGFRLVEVATRQVVFEGTLNHRPDIGYTHTPLPYQQVYEADFTSFTIPGEYWLQVPGLGVSLPFLIHDSALGAIARTYALGIYHQRCGAENTLPYTRHIHAACHTALAEVPNMSFPAVNSILAQVTANYANEPRHTAPQLSNVNASLYPYVKTNRIDVSGGHHDAGDYSKYTINSAQFIHTLIFVVDLLPQVRQLDNLGLPESGDGISDLLQLAKWEADFLLRMQDADGGFYFLVYPRNRRYEHDVLPDRGDPQVVFPKTTTVTAAAVAALAQMASSPIVQHHYPEEAAVYLHKAVEGWEFLQRAITAYGRDGSYQKITHYGTEFMHHDELAWAATELFLATGDSRYHEDLLRHFDPSDPKTRVWGWWRLFEGYGCAIRSYAFSEATGRRPNFKLDPIFLDKCRAEILAAAEFELLHSQLNAYGVSFPLPNKPLRTAGWFFPANQAFDLMVAAQLDPKPEYTDAILANINYEAGNNPLNLPFLTGIGRKRQREIVHQYSQNDRRLLPPSGIPVGAMQMGFAFVDTYKSELTNLTYPPDNGESQIYAPYDRWGDSFNTTTEFVAVQQARGLATATFIWTASFGANGSWQPAEGIIEGVPPLIELGAQVTAHLSTSELDTTGAITTWESREQEPSLGPIYTFTPTNIGPHWIEAEMLLPDGRRVFATNEFNVSFPAHWPPHPHQPYPTPLLPDIAALYHLDFNGSDTSGKQWDAELFGDAKFDSSNIGWMSERTGAALRFEDKGDYALMRITNSALFDPGTQAIVLEAMIYIAKYADAPTNLPLVSLVRNWNANVELIKNPYLGLTFRGGTQFEIHGNAVSNALPRNRWNHLRLAIGKSGYSVRINGELVAFQPSNELENWSDPRGYSTLSIGNFEGWVDEVVVRNSKTNPLMNLAAMRMPDGEMQLRIFGAEGIQFLLRRSTDLLTWSTLSTNILDSNPTELLVPNNAGRQFFTTISIP